MVQKTGVYGKGLKEKYLAWVRLGSLGFAWVRMGGGGELSRRARYCLGEGASHHLAGLPLSYRFLAIAYPHNSPCSDERKIVFR